MSTRFAFRTTNATCRDIDVVVVVRTNAVGENASILDNIQHEIITRMLHIWRFIVDVCVYDSLNFDEPLLRSSWIFDAMVLLSKQTLSSICQKIPRSNLTGAN